MARPTDLNQIRMHELKLLFQLTPYWYGVDDITDADTQRVIQLGQQGSAPSESLYPISFDVAPDGRIFVLDAGNNRIQTDRNDKGPLGLSI